MKKIYWIGLIVLAAAVSLYVGMAYTNKQYEPVKGQDGKAVVTNGKDTYIKK